MSYRLVALDLDGTLLNSRKEISPRTLAAIRRARERGVHVAIATGRTVHSTLHHARLAGTVGPHICCNGAGILDEQGAVAIRRPLPVAALVRTIEICKAEGLLIECYGVDGIYLDQPVRQMRTFLGWVRGQTGLAGGLRWWAREWRLNRFRSVSNLKKWAEEGGVPVLKVFVLGPPAELERARTAMEATLPQLEVSSSGPGNIELTAAGVSKGTALRQLGEWLKIPREQIIAVGDSYNDLTMLDYAGLGVAMGNAAPDVKAVAGHITATCDEDGVAQVIEEFCLG